ncbi:unnamed protein product [Chrysoparadoxa australica]
MPSSKLLMKLLLLLLCAGLNSALKEPQGYSRRREQPELSGQVSEDVHLFGSWQIRLTRWRKRRRKEEESLPVKEVPGEIHGRKIEKLMVRVGEVLTKVLVAPWAFILWVLSKLHFKPRALAKRALGRGAWVQPPGGVSGRESCPPEHRWMVDTLRQQVREVPGLEADARTTEHALDDATLVRFIEAAYYEWEVKGTPLIEIIKNTVAWRKSFGAHKLKAEEVKDVSNGEMFVHGVDAMKRPVIYFTPALCRRGHVNDEVRLLVYTLERAWRAKAWGVNQMTLIVNCEGLGLTHMLPIYHIKAFFKVLQDHYPMRLGVVLVVNLGPTGHLCWTLVQGLVPERTKAKMRFLKKKGQQAQLESYICARELARELGGDYDYDYDTYFSERTA